MELAAGTVVDRYVVDQVLGEGGMAVVYLCNHTQLGTQHALKVLTISSRAIRERLVQEGQVQAQLRHPNIVAVTDIVMINGAPGLVMEYIDGPSVDDLLEDRTLSYEQVDVLAEGILTGVAHAHAQGLVHRDLKPANIMLAVRGSSLVPKVTDFGLAKLLDSDTNRAATRTGSTMGTPHYMSPEQVSDSKNVDHRTDVFALGAVLYEMVAGQRAFSGDNLLQLFSAAAKGRYTPIRELKPDIPDRMEAAIHGALEPDRDKRIQSAEDLLAIWKGEKLRGMGKQAEVPAGPFDAAFLKSVKSISSLSSGSSSSPDPTWNPGAGAEVVHVESVFKAAPVPLAPAPRVDAVSSSSLVSGKSLVVGGGAAMLFAGGIGVVSVIVVGALGFWWANRPAEPRQVTRLEDRVQPISDPASRVPGPIPEVGPVPGPGGVQPVAEPISTAPSQAPQLVAPVGPVPTVVVPAQPDPMEPTEPDPGEPDPTEPDPTEPDPTEPVEPEPPAPDVDPNAVAVNPAGLQSDDPKLRIEAVISLRGVPSSTGTLLQLVVSDPDPRVQREAHESLVVHAVKRRGDLPALKSYFEEAMAKNAFDQTGKNVRAYGSVCDDFAVVERFLVQQKGATFNQRKGLEAVENIAVRTNRKADGLQVLQRVDAAIEGKLARGTLEAVRENLAR